MTTVQDAMQSTRTKYRDIAEGLLRKTRVGDAGWKIADEIPHAGGFISDSSREMTDLSHYEFRLDLPTAIIELKRLSPRTEPDIVRMRVTQRDETWIDIWNVQEGDEDWRLFDELYQAARLRVAGWDDFLNDLARTINRDGPIGLNRLKP